MTPDEELEIVERYMREHGYRWTNQRRLIAVTAFGTHDHFTAEELLDMCRREDSQVSRATVYRTLSMLEEAGFVASLDTGENGRRFEHVLGHDQHDHMVCEECGRIVEFVEPELERMREAVARKHGFRIVSQTLKLLVACDDPDCEHRRGGSTPS